MTTKKDISKWFTRGFLDEKHYMFVIRDQFDWEEFPVYATEETYDDLYKEYNHKNMMTIIEIYNLREPREPQLEDLRSWNGK